MTQNSEQNPKYKYAAFGLTCASEFECAGLPSGTGLPDLVIRRGSVPDHLPSPQARGVLFEATPERYLLRIKNVAKYLVERGSLVTVEATGLTPGRDIETFLLGPAITAALQQRGALVLHAGVIVGARGAVLIAGRSGYGKSTLVMALVKRGYRLLSDDVAVIRLDDHGQLVAFPGLSYVKLWEDAAVRYGCAENLTPVRQGLRKFAIEVGGAFQGGPTPVTAMCVLEMHAKGDVETHQLEQSERFRAVCVQTRAFPALQGLNVQQQHFRLSAELAARVPIRVLRRPRGAYTVDALAEHVESDLR